MRPLFVKLGDPCVLCVKIAARGIEDGNLVEVDASAGGDHGC